MTLLKKSLISITALALLTLGCENKTKNTDSSTNKKETSSTSSNVELSTSDKIKKYKSLWESAENNCKATIDSNDMMRYQQNNKDINELKISLSCNKFYIRLRHTGKLAAQIMGHNLVIAKTSDAPSLVQTCLAAGRSANYLPNDPKILAKSNTLVGGGNEDIKEDYMEVNTSKFDKNSAYTFFCSYPGHFGIMKGTIKF